MVCVSRNKKSPRGVPARGGRYASSSHRNIKKRERALSKSVFRYQARFSSTINPKQLSRNNVCATFSWSVACSWHSRVVKGDWRFVFCSSCCCCYCFKFYLWSKSLQAILFWVKKKIIIKKNLIVFIKGKIGFVVRSIIIEILYIDVHIYRYRMLNKESQKPLRTITLFPNICIPKW